MIRFFKSIPYHVKTAFNSLTRHFALTFSSATAVTVTLTLLMTFLVIAGNVSNFTYNVEDSLKIHSTIEATLSDDQIDDLKKEIERMNYVKTVTFSSKDEELESYLNDLDESARKLYEVYRGEGNPLLNAFIVEVNHGDNLSIVNNQILKLEGIHDSAFGGDSAITMVKAMDGIRITGGAFVIALSILAVFLISNTIKSAIHARKDEIAIMRQVGATNGFIKFPFMIEGMFIGILGSIIPILVCCVGYSYLFDKLGGQLFTAIIKIVEPSSIIYLIMIVLVAVGALVGAFGSYLSVRKYLKI